MQTLQYTSAWISPHLHPYKVDQSPVGSGPLQGLHTFKWHVACCPSAFLSKDLQNHPQVLGPFLCPRVTKAKLLTWVDQLRLSIWSICHESVTLRGGPLRTYPLGHQLLVFPFLPHNEPRHQAEAHGLTVLVIVPCYLIGWGAGLLKTTHLSLSMCLCCCSSSCLCSLGTGAASHKALSIFAVRPVRKPTLWCPWQPVLPFWQMGTHCL